MYMGSIASPLADRLTLSLLDKVIRLTISTASEKMNLTAKLLNNWVLS